MAILCGTDFSEPAHEALIVAAHLAVRMQRPLHLVNSAALGSESGAAETSEFLDWTLRRLHLTADQARALGAEVFVHLKRGAPDETLLELARDLDADLIVMGLFGQPAPGTSHVEGFVERLLHSARAPVLIVREARPFVTWLTDRSRLHVVLGADLSRSTEAAMAILERWRRVGPCQVTAVHLYWPPEQVVRLGVDATPGLRDSQPEITKTLTGELTRRLVSADDSDPIDVRVEPHSGGFGDRLADIALERQADLLVVGSHARSAVARFLDPSVSRAVLHTARSSVLFVPATSVVTTTAVPRMRNVLAATDFSPEGNAAVGLAYALVERGGTVHLVHVVPVHELPPLSSHDIFALEHSSKPDARRNDTHAALEALLPAGPVECATRVHTVEAPAAAPAICQAALRLDADAICVGGRARPRLATALLGSVSSDVVSVSERPVFIAHAPRE
jgi:nucleotide-binding universal stress UspA family protein